MKPTAPSDSLRRKLLFYSVGAGALSAASAGQAAVVSAASGQTGSTFYFTLQNTTVSTSAPATSYFEFYDGKGKSVATTSNSGTAGQANNYAVATESKPGPNSAATNYVLKLGVGATIGSQTFNASGTFNNYYVHGNYNVPSGAKNGDWTPGSRGFVGLTITTGGGQKDFGFADVTLNNVGRNNSYTVNGLAYDNTGAAITTFAIPEPASTAALLVAGAAGAAALRKRRRRA